MILTTPNFVTVAIEEFCRSIAPNVTPMFISVCPDKEGRVNECYQNVDNYVLKNGGQRLLGWCIWEWSGVLLEAEAHAIWKSPNGCYIDITPHEDKEQKILFLHDQNLFFDGNRIPSKRKELTNEICVKKYIEVCNRIDQFLVENPADGVLIPDKLNIEKCKLLKQIFLIPCQNQNCH
jgi:hypothetical protein